MSHAASTENTLDSFVQPGFSQMFWLASAEFGIKLPRPATRVKITGRRYISLEPLVGIPSGDESEGSDPVRYLGVNLRIGLQTRQRRIQ